MQALVPSFLFGLIALILFGVSAWLLMPGVREFKLARASRRWPSVLGKVISANVIYQAPINTDMDSHYRRGSYRPVIEYAYAVNGKNYRANHRVFGDESVAYTISSRAEAIVNNYPQEREVQVYYDPATPGNAVLEPGKIGTVLTALVAGVVCLTIGLLLAWASIAVVMAQRPG